MFHKQITEISSVSMMSDSSIPAEHAEHQINVNSSGSFRTVAEQSINIDSFVANASMDEEQSSIANSVSRNILLIWRHRSQSILIAP